MDFKVPSAWRKICATKKVNRFRPPEVTAAAAEQERAAERLQVRLTWLCGPPSSLATTLCCSCWSAGRVLACDTSQTRCNRTSSSRRNVLALQAACKEAWADLLARFAAHCPAFRAAAHALAMLDCLQALAATAQTPDFSRPHFIDEADSARVEVEGGRAPLLDALLAGGAVPNDVKLGGRGAPHDGHLWPQHGRQVVVHVPGAPRSLLAHGREVIVCSFGIARLRTVRSAEAAAV